MVVSLTNEAWWGRNPLTANNTPQKWKSLSQPLWKSANGPHRRRKDLIVEGERRRSPMGLEVVAVQEWEHMQSLDDVLCPIKMRYSKGLHRRTWLPETLTTLINCHQFGSLVEFQVKFCPREISTTRLDTTTPNSSSCSEFSLLHLIMYEILAFHHCCEPVVHS